MISVGHNFAHAMIAQLSWHLQNCELSGSFKIKMRAKLICTRFQLWDHKQCHGWVYACTQPMRDVVKKYLKSAWNVWYGSLDRLGDDHLSMFSSTWNAAGHSANKGNLCETAHKLMTFHSSISPILVVASFSNFTQSLVVKLTCLVQNCEMIEQLRKKVMGKQKFTKSRWIWGAFLIL